MVHRAYLYKRIHARRYVFVSTGRKDIEKVVEFTSSGLRNTMNLGFGDLLPDGTMDDGVNSNNGDIVKVLATIVNIVCDFTARQPGVIICFTGNTEERTRLYRRIMKTYYPLFSKSFILEGGISSSSCIETERFDLATAEKYQVFFIKRIS